MKKKDWITSIIGGSILGILIVALQAFGYIPQALRAHAASDIEEILTKTLQSDRNWSSLEGEVELTQYDADNNPHVDVIAVQIEQPLKANITIKVSDEKEKVNNKLVSDGLKIYEIDNTDLSYSESNIPSFATKTDLIPQTLADVKKGEVYHHPFEMLISNPIMEYVYPAWFAQGSDGTKYQLAGEETVANRSTWKVEFLTPYDMVTAWIDQETGIILKYRQATIDGQFVVGMEFNWVEINNQIDKDKFAPPDKEKYNKVDH